MPIPNIDDKGAEARANASRVVLLIAALLLMVPGLSFTLRMTLAGLLIVAGLVMRYESKKRWCVLRACGIKTPL